MTLQTLRVNVPKAPESPHCPPFEVHMPFVLPPLLVAALLQEEAQRQPPRRVRFPLDDPVSLVVRRHPLNICGVGASIGLGRFQFQATETLWIFPSAAELVKVGALPLSSHPDFQILDVLERRLAG